ncbi:MAG: IS21 family transposase [Solirubrobacteraceae bacterium]|nr:IS21 family transposase [Solirubrobacteraceae bacterium]
MSKVREVLRVHWSLGRSVRETARATSTSHGVVSKIANRAKCAGLDWGAVDALGDEALEQRLYGGPKFSRSPERPLPDPAWMHVELRRPGVTLELLHLEYLRENPKGFRYTAFCEVYRRWLKGRGVTMRQRHVAGEKMFVDYSGKRPSVADPTTGEIRAVELFVAVLGASNLTYAEVTWTQRIPDFLGAHVRAFEFFGGVSKITVPDQLRSAVRVPCKYEPTIARSYEDLGRHYGTAIVPARPGKPRDKAKVEVAVQVAQRWVIARLRNEIFFSLPELNVRIRELLEELNERPMKKLGGLSRRVLFERIEKSALSPLPADPFVVSEWCRAKVNVDYHVSVGKHLYSAPFVYVHEDVEVRLTHSTVELFHRGKRIASHVRSAKYGFTTDVLHMPESHRQHFAGGDALLAWSSTVGPMTAALVQRLFDANPVREQGWRSAKGLQRLAKKYGDLRLEAACEQAVRFGARSYKPVERILALGRESAEREPQPGTPIAHENVRGPDYFH